MNNLRQNQNYIRNAMGEMQNIARKCIERNGGEVEGHLSFFCCCYSSSSDIQFILYRVKPSV